MEESKFRREKAELQRILQEEIDRLGATGRDMENLVRIGVIAWITADVGDNECYSKSQLRELFDLVNEKSPRDATRKARNK